MRFIPITRFRRRSGSMMRTRRMAAATAAALVGALLITSCGSSDSSTQEDGKTLRLWHYEGPDSAMGVAWNQAVAEFKKTHPDVKVEFEAKGFEQIQKTASMVLNSNNAP